MGSSPNPSKQYVTICVEDVGGQDTQKAVSAAEPIPVNVVLGGASPADAITTGTLSGTGETVVVALVGQQSVAVDISGVWSAEIFFEQSVDNGVTYAGNIAIIAGAGNSQGLLTIVNGRFQFSPTGGMSHARVRMASFVSGTATISLRATSGTPGLVLARTVDTVTAIVSGVDANDQPVAVNPLVAGGRASDAVPSAVSADGDAVYAWRDRRGADQVVLRDSAGALLVGQQPMATSVPVAVASDQSAIPISAATLPLPTGAATSALQLPNSHDVTVDNAAGVSAVNIQDGGNSLTVDGTFFQATQPVSAASLPLPTGASTLAGQTQPGVDIGDVTVNNGAGAAAVNIQDGGNSVTVDGTFFQATQPVSAASLPLPTGASTLAGQTQPGVDIGDVTINNAAGASAVNIQDGGNSVTVDGTVTANPATSFGKTITYVSVNQGAAGTTVLAAASASNRHKIIGATLVMSAAGTLKFSDGVGDLTGPMDLATNGGFVWPPVIIPIQQTAVNSALNLVTTVGAARGIVAILTEA